MKPTASNTNQDIAASAFSKQSAVFDSLYASNTIIAYKRKRVREHIEQFLCPSSHILELNAGTGEDAIYFAKKNHRVHATDIAVGMQEQLITKVNQQQLTGLISTELCSFTQLENLENPGPFDYIFSNFAGLNCTHELDKVLNSFSYLLQKDGYVTLVILPKFCLWEFMLLFRGKFKTAFRRFTGKKGAKAHVEGEYFRCWYYNPSFIKRRLKNDFTLMALEGLCSFVPPSYIENFAEKHPGIFQFLQAAEHKRKNAWPWRSIGDYYIMTLKKK